jgi:hypothetical protein
VLWAEEIREKNSKVISGEDVFSVAENESMVVCNACSAKVSGEG